MQIKSSIDNLTLAPPTDGPGLTVATDNAPTSPAIQSGPAGAPNFTVSADGDMVAQSLLVSGLGANSLFDAALTVQWAGVNVGLGVVGLPLPLDLTEQATPADPGAGRLRLYAGTDHLLHTVDSSSTDRTLSTYADPLTTRGDVLVRNASNVTARLAVGTSGKVLRSDGTDVSWAAIAAGDLPDPHNAFGIRTALGSNAAGLYVPWITGDTATTLTVGSSGSGNNQTAISARSNSNSGINTLSVSGVPLVATATPTSGSSTPIVTSLRNQSSGTPAAGLGVELQFSGYSDTSTLREQANITSAWSTATDASRAAYLAFSTTNAGTVGERLRIGPTGATVIRATDFTQAAGLYVPWVSGDSTNTILAGASTSGNNQVAVTGKSDSGHGLVGQSVSGVGVYAQITSGTNPALVGLMTDANTATAPSLLAVRHRSSGTPAASFGGAITLQAQSSTTTDQLQAALTATWVVATHASRTARLTLSAYDTAAREGLRIEASGSAPLLGFFGGSAAGKPTVSGSRGANAALASLLTALAGLGLLTDSSS